jgi:mRNA interferase RelE/StbE
MPASSPQRYRVEVKKAAQKILSRLPKDLLNRIAAAIESLAADPRPTGCKKLAGMHDHYRMRVGDWRIIYTIQDDVLLIIVVEVAPRGGAYRDL